MVVSRSETRKATYAVRTVMLPLACVVALPYVPTFALALVLQFVEGQVLF